MTSVWFSAMLRFVILVERGGGDDLARSVVLFRADDFPAAKARAIEIGLGMEQTYQSNTDEQVRWRLLGVETVDMLGEEITDGREVYAEPIPLATGISIPFDATFDPAAKEPGQSGV